MTKAINGMTGTVHYAHSDGTGLVQNCGIKRDQHLYLAPVADGTDITCKRCQGARQAAPAVTTVERRVYGAGEWTITELRELAGSLRIAGRSMMTGEELLAAITPLRPHVH